MDIKKTSYTILGADLLAMVFWFLTKATAYAAVLYWFVFLVSSMLTFLATLASLTNFNKYKHWLFLVYAVISVSAFIGIFISFFNTII